MHIKTLQILGRTSLCFTEQETQEENELGGPTPLWVSTYTSYLLYKVPVLYSISRQSDGMAKTKFSSIFSLVKTSPCFTGKETQEENELG